MIDAAIRRAIQLVFSRHAELSTDAFVWLALGSNGRREAMPSSDIDAAVIFDDAVSPAEQQRFRAAFSEVEQVLSAAGLRVDAHGARTTTATFSRTNLEWLTAARNWLLEPQADKGILMISLLVDARPIHGDPGLPAVSRLLRDVRRHPRTLDILRREALAHPARRPGMRGLVAPRASSFDVKTRGLLPIVNIARWFALSEGSADLRTVDRLQARPQQRSDSAPAILSQNSADRLREVFALMQQLRLRHQLRQVETGVTPTDIIDEDELTTIERRMVGQGIREIDSVRRRMDRIAGLARA